MRYKLLSWFRQCSIEVVGLKVLAMKPNDQSVTDTGVIHCYETQLVECNCTFIKFELL